jgi:antitoxin MazE
MKTKVQRWGNSLALRIPKAFAEETRVKDGTSVELLLSDGALVMRPTKQAKRSLSALLAQVDSGNLNFGVNEDTPRGKEAW